MKTRQLLTTLAFIVIGLVAGVSRAGDPVWIQGMVSPPKWAIDPLQPRDIDVVHFSGPISTTYLNRCLAEVNLGGHPTLAIDSTARTVELKFTPPAAAACSDAVQPVCGLEGNVGPLGSGQWRFFCTKPGVAFSLTFRVTHETKKSILYVDASAAGAHDGSSWTRAFKYVQDALAVASWGTEVRVAAGTYRPDQGGACTKGDPSATFHLRSGVTLKGGYAGLKGVDPNDCNVTLHETILSGDLAANDKVAHPYDMIDPSRRSDNSYHVVSTNNADTAAVLDGFTITGGGNFRSDIQDERGNGAGIYNDAGRAIIQNCRIVNNAAQGNGGGLFSSGGDLTLLNCTITGNWANACGGAIHIQSSDDLAIDRCVLNGNVAGIAGGAVSSKESTDSTDGFDGLTISNSVIAGNLVTDASGGEGGALLLCQTQVQLDHCTITENRAVVGAALVCGEPTSFGQGYVTLKNCIVWNGTNSILSMDHTIVEAAYCDIQGGYGGTGNLFMNPLFAKTGKWDLGETATLRTDDTWTAGDYHLTDQSPCIDMGDPSQTPSADDLDLAGRPRRIGAAVDMGAYEWGNDSPVAKAVSPVAGFSTNGQTGLVTLDGSASYDPEGKALTYRWYRGDLLVSTAARFTIELPIGDSLFTLIVNDGFTDSRPVQVTVHVTGYTVTVLNLVPNPISRSSGDDTITAILLLPSGKEPGDFDPSKPLQFVPGYVLSTSQEAKVWMNGNRLVFATFNKADVLKAIPANGATTVQVVGQLKNGTAFGASQTVTISK
jgi:hypothetical protein